MRLFRQAPGWHRKADRSLRRCGAYAVIRCVDLTTKRAVGMIVQRVIGLAKIAPQAAGGDVCLQVSIKNACALAVRIWKGADAQGEKRQENEGYDSSDRLQMHGSDVTLSAP